MQELSNLHSNHTGNTSSNCFDLGHIQPRNTPLPVGIILDNTMSSKTDSLMDNKSFQAVLCLVMWGQLTTRTDFAVSLLFHFQVNPGIPHWTTLMHVVGYIKNTIDFGLTYFCDAAYASCLCRCRLWRMSRYQEIDFQLCLFHVWRTSHLK